MNRTGLLTALAIAVASGLVFGCFPRLDLEIAGLFFDPASRSFLNEETALWGIHWAAAARDLSMWVVAALAAPAAVTLLLKVVRPRMRLALPLRATLLLLTSLALAPGLLINVLLKEHWGRPRPIEVRDFAGAQQFMPWWDPRGQCPRNCSFVTGEGASAFWTLAPAAVAPAAMRALAYAGAIAFGCAVGILRMASGGHFFTDVVCSGVLTFLIIWVLHGLLYRWRALAGGDRALEQQLEAMLVRGYASLGHSVVRLFSRAARSPASD